MVHATIHHQEVLADHHHQALRLLVRLHLESVQLLQQVLRRLEHHAVHDITRTLVAQLLRVRQSQERHTIRLVLNRQQLVLRRLLAVLVIIQIQAVELLRLHQLERTILLVHSRVQLVDTLELQQHHVALVIIQTQVAEIQAQS